MKVAFWTEEHGEQNQVRGSMKHVWTVSREIWLEQRVPLGKQARETLVKSFSQQNQHRWWP